MLPFAESIGAWGFVTLAAALVGVWVIALLGSSIQLRYLSAFGLGIFLWFFVDTLEGSSDLVVGEGFGGGVSQLVVVLLFAFGVLSFLLADRDAVAGDGLQTPFLVPMLAALALGVHGLGEGLAFGSTAAQTSSGSLVDAFGGGVQAAAYALHKVLEPMMVGALYVGYTRGSPRSLARSAREMVALASIFVLPSVVGSIVGYFWALDTTYLFALGAGTSVYAFFRLSKPLLSGVGPRVRDSVLVALSLLAGFILIYLAALLHS